MWCTNSLTFNNCTLCPHCIYVFCFYLRTNSDLCHLHHELTGFCNRNEKCLQRGTNWVFKWSSLCFVFKGLTCVIFCGISATIVASWLYAYEMQHILGNSLSSLQRKILLKAHDTTSSQSHTFIIFWLVGHCKADVPNVKIFLSHFITFWFLFKDEEFFPCAQPTY